MKKPLIFLTRKIHPQAMDLLFQKCEVEVWQKTTPPPHTALLEKANQVDGLLTMLTDPVDEEVIKSSTLRVISQMAVGTDNIDLTAATLRRLPVGHTPGVLTETCADFTIGLLLAGSRRIVEAHNEVHSGVWRPWGPEVLTGSELFGSTLGLVGFGRIGQAVARRAAGFDMQILYSDRKRNLDLERKFNALCVSLDELLSSSDFISIHIYYSPENHHLFDYAQFEKMKPSSFLVNTSRGQVVNPAALVWALQNKIIAGAALDVFEPEPIPSGHALLSMPNVIITPHIASAGVHTRMRMALIAANNLLAGLTNERLPFCANPEIYTP